MDNAIVEKIYEFIDSLIEYIEYIRTNYDDPNKILHLVIEIAQKYSPSSAYKKAQLIPLGLGFEFLDPTLGKLARELANIRRDHGEELFRKIIKQLE